MKTNYCILLLITWYMFSGFGAEEPVNRKAEVPLPVFVSYLKKTPPDSIRDFIKVYLQTQKYEVIDWETTMQLFKQEMNEAMLSWIHAGKINRNTQENSEELIKSLNPVCTVLAIDLYRDSTSPNSFITDSILWHTGTMPVKDTNFIIHKFTPATDLKPNPYLTLKSFADEVIRSGKLNQ